MTAEHHEHRFGRLQRSDPIETEAPDGHSCACPSGPGRGITEISQLSFLARDRMDNLLKAHIYLAPSLASTALGMLYSRITASCLRKPHNSRWMK